MKERSKRGADQFVLRLPDGMRDRIKVRAATSRRTMNSEIIHYLDRALAADEAKGPAGAPTPPSRDHNPATPMETGNDATT